MNRRARGGSIAAYIGMIAVVCLSATANAQGQIPEESVTPNGVPAQEAQFRAADDFKVVEVLPNPLELPDGDAVEAGDGGGPLSALSREQKAEVVKLYEQLKAADEKKKKAADDSKKKQSEEDGHDVGSDLKLNANWNNGLWFTTANKDWNIHFGGRFQFEPVWFNQPTSLQGPPPGPGGIPASKPGDGDGVDQDGSFFRRVRLRSDGVGYETIEYVMEVDFEQINLITFDHAWVGVKDIPVLGSVRVGQHKIPQGMEMIGSDYHLTFLERSSLSDAFWTLFGQGIFVSNTYLDDNVTFQTMIHRIQPNGYYTNDFGNGDYASTSRLTWTPYYAEEGRHLVHFGGSYQWRRADLGASILPGGTGNAGADGQRVVRFRARPELRDGTGIAFPYGNTGRFIDTGFVLADSVSTLSPEFLWIGGPMSIQAEGAVTMTSNVRSIYGPTPGRNFGMVTYYGGYAQASYMLTGENRGYDRRFGMFDRPKVRENFLAQKHQNGGIIWAPGAWEMAYRYSYINLDDKGLNGGIMGQHTVGLNWYLNDNVKLQFNYNRADRTVATPAVSGGQDGFGLLAQWYF